MLRFVAFLACVFAPAAIAAQDVVDPVVAEAATTFRNTVARAPRDTAHYRSVRAEGQVLVIEIELTAAVPDFIGPTQALSAIAGGWCADAQAATFFGNGRSMRLHLFREGRAVGSATIDHCPGPVGRDLSAETFAGTMQSVVGMVIDGVRVIAVGAEGDMLVVRLDVVSGPSGSGARAVADFLSGFCERPDAQAMFFDNHMTMRIDTTVQGREPVTGTLIASCPGR